MTLSEVLQIITDSYPASTPDRVKFSDASAVINCAYEVQSILSGTPSVANYVAYLNTQKADSALSICARRAEDVFTAIAAVETSSGSAEDLTSAMASFYSAQEACVSNVSAAASIQQSDLGLDSLRTRIANFVSNGFTEPETREVFSIVGDTIPIQGDGRGFTMGSGFLVNSDGNVAQLTYNGSIISPYGVITEGSTVAGVEVVSVDKYYFTTAQTIPSGATVQVSLYSWDYSPVVVAYTTNPRAFVTYALQSSLPVNRQAASVKSCIRGFGISDTRGNPVEAPSFSFAPATLSAYRSIETVCAKWKQPQVLQHIHEIGFNLSNTKALTPLDSLSDVFSRIAQFTDTRGLIV